MTRSELSALITARIAADPAAQAALDDGRPGDLAAMLSEGRKRLVSTHITERGVIAELGVVDGEAFLSGLEAFSAMTLADGHPFKAAHPGIKRMLGWLKNADGLDIGTAAAQQMLAGLGAGGVVNAGHAVRIASLALRPDPINASDVADAINEGLK
jgi:hypothetical protein